MSDVSKYQRRLFLPGEPASELSRGGCLCFLVGLSGTNPTSTVVKSLIPKELAGEELEPIEPKLVVREGPRRGVDGGSVAGGVGTLCSGMTSSSIRFSSAL